MTLGQNIDLADVLVFMTIFNKNIPFDTTKPLFCSSLIQGGAKVGLQF